MPIIVVRGAYRSRAVLKFYHNESRLVGVDSLKRDLTQSARMLDALRPQFESGAFRPAPLATTFGLAEVTEAYLHVAAGAPGRVVLTPQG